MSQLGSQMTLGMRWGVLQLLKLHSLNQLGWGPLWLLSHIHLGAIAQGPRSL